MNPAHTSIHPPPYEGKLGDTELSEGSRLCQYLIAMAESGQNVTDFIREQPFEATASVGSSAVNGILFTL